MRKLFGLAFLLLLAAGLARADVPVRREQFIYSVLAFAGTNYTGTFTTEESDTLYLLAGVDNFLNARKSLVYFWPLTESWMTDNSALNFPFEGKLQVLGPGGRSQLLTPQRFTFYNVAGEYELNWKVAHGAEADEVWKNYQEKMDAFYRSVDEYYKARRAYETGLQELAARINRLREAGRDVSGLVKELEEMQPPVEPKPPRDYVAPPAQVQAAFILNLPVGEYHIRFLLPDGSSPEGRVMEGSEKRVVVFERRRHDGVGLEVIPGDKWTRPVESQTPASVLYVDGTTDLYLQPFFQDEYNDLYYEKLKKNDAKANPNLMKWVRMQQVPAAGIRVTVGGGAPGGADAAGGSFPSAEGGGELLREQPFYVEQLPGASLGYRIVPFDPQGAHKDREPSLRAFHVPIRRESGVIRLQVEDRQGKVLAGGERQIRVLVKSRLQGLLLVIALLPLAAMAAVLVRRARRTAR